MEMILKEGFSELEKNEMQEVDGGDTYRRDRIEYLRENDLMQYSEESQKAAVSYTLGYLSLATCWCSPLSFVLGAAGTLYSCM